MGGSSARAVAGKVQLEAKVTGLRVLGRGDGERLLGVKTEDSLDKGLG